MSKQISAVEWYENRIFILQIQLEKKEISLGEYSVTRVEFGIEITKPWSVEMYDHNEAVAEVVRFEVKELLDAALCNFLEDFDLTEDALALPWYEASGDLVEIQKAVTCYGFGSGYTIGKVADTVEQELEDAPYYRLKVIAEELGLELEKGFVGFN